MEDIYNQAPTSESFSITINDEMKHDMIKGAKWAKFMSILGFVFLGILLVIIFSIKRLFTFLSGMMGSVSTFPDQYMESIGSLIAIPYVIMAVIYFFPVLYLFQYSSRTIRGLKMNDQQMFGSGMKKLMAHFRYVGVLTITIIALEVIIIWSVF